MLFSPSMRARQVLLGAVAVVALLLLLAWLALPHWLRRAVQEQGTAALGRDVHIDALHFNPLTLTATVEGLSIAGPTPGAPPLLRLPKGVVNVDMRSLLRLAPVVEALDLHGPELRVARLADGRYDIDDLLARLRPARPAEAAAPPARFALYNLRLHDGRVRFDDRPRGRVHEVSAVALGLPFLSNLDDALDVQVEPRLAFRLGDARFDTGAQARPFTQDRSGVLTLKAGDVDLAEWLAYLPAGLPVQPESGRLAVDLAIHFKAPSGGTPALSIQGGIEARDLAVVDAAGALLVGADRLAVQIDDLQPLQRRVALRNVAMDGLKVSAARDARGRLNWQQALATQAASPSPKPAPGEGAAWQVSLGRLALKDGQLRWRDHTVQPVAEAALEGVALQLDGLRWPVVDAALAAKLSAEARLVIPGGAPAPAAGIRLAGDWTAAGGQLQARLGALPLAAAAPYLATVLKPRLEGELDLEAVARWLGAPGAQAPSLHINSAQLNGLKASLPGNRQPVAGWQRLRLADLEVDPVKRTLSLGHIELSQPHVRARREAGGQIDLAQWLVATPPAAAGAEADPPWTLSLAEGFIDGGRLAWQDAASQQPTALDLQRVALRVRTLRWPADAESRASLQGSVQVLAPAGGTPGELAWQGELGLAPLQWRGRLKAQRLPVHAVAGYAAAALPVRLGRAEAGWEGQVAARWEPQGLTLDMQGDARVDSLLVLARRAAGVRDGDELLSWQSLELPGVVLAMAPARAPRVTLSEARLSDFYARLSVDESGLFNLSGLNAPAPAGSTPAASAPAAASPAAPALELAVAGLELQRGRVDFSDRYIRPNYSAVLSELNGRIGAFRTGTRDMAPLDLRGRVAGTGLLELHGAVNPTARPLALDVQARASELELAPLSPYAAKYAGHGIERGKLSMDVAYRIDADGRLQARNQLVLNQLTFGERIDSPTATKLPVLLAVALLKDDDGVIDLDLPISGSINDPEFSLGGVVVKLITNLLAKALTAPFALLAGAGEQDLSVVEFQPGTTRLADGAGRAIDKVARALASRPALQMTVTGAADPQGERQAIQAAWLDQRLTAEWRKERGRADDAADSPAPEAEAWAPDERARLVRRLYADTPLPDKPRNLLGLQKDVAPAEMEALLRGSHAVSTDNARELALQRGRVVRDALIAKGLPAERLVLAAPELRAPGEGDGSWTPRVQLGLRAP